jgi:hypothetical protein
VRRRESRDAGAASPPRKAATFVTRFSVRAGNCNMISPKSNGSAWPFGD